MPAQELTWKVSIDPAIAQGAMRDLVASVNSSNSQITASINQQAKAAVQAANQEFKEIQAIHSAKVRLADDEFKEIQRIHDAKIRLAEQEVQRDFNDIQRIHAEKLKMAAADAALAAKMQTEVRGFATKNEVDELGRFQAMLRLNSIGSRLAADDFLRLLGPVKSVGTEAGVAAREGSKVSEVLRAIASSAVIAEGPMGGISSRLRGVSAEATELGRIIGPTGIVIGGMLALGFGAGLLADTIFKLTERAAAAGKEILEISEKTNLSTESISAFKLASELAGRTIAETGGKLAGFNVALGQAQSGNKEMVKAFKDMGVSLNQTSEGALAQFLKRFDEMGPSAARNSLEAKIFRDRTGDLIPVLNELGGSLDEAKKKAYDLGLSFDEVSAREAKAFSDALKTIRLGSEGLAQQIGQKDIPAIQSALGELSRALGLQENSWRAWGEYIGNVLSGVVINTAAAVAAINQALSNIKTGVGVGASQTARLASDAAGVTLGGFGSLNPLQGYRSGANLLNEVFGPSTADAQAWKNALTPAQAFDAEQARMKNLIGNWKPPAGAGASDVGNTGTGGGGGAGKKAKDQVAAEIELEREKLRGLEQVYKDEADSYERSLRARNISLQEFVDKSKELELERHAATEPILLKELNLAEKTRDANQRQINVQKALNALAAEHFKFTKSVEDSEAQSQEQQVQLEQKYADIRLAIEEKADDERKAAVKDLIQSREVSQEEGEKRLTQIQLDAIDRRTAATEKELEAAKKDAVKRADIQLKLGVLEQERANAVAAGNRSVAEARNRDIENFRQYESAYERLVISGLNIEQEIARIRIQILKTTRASRLDIVNAEFAELRIAEDRQHERSLAELQSEKDAALKKASTWHDLLAVLKQYDRDVEKENKRHLEQQKADELEEQREKFLASKGGGLLGGLQTGQLQELEKGVQSFRDVAITAFSAVGAVVNGLAQGVGNLIQQWVLLGDAGPNAIRKMVASVLAGVAAQAATLAVMELAMAFACLVPGLIPTALYGTAAQHFKAAALFGVIATGAALAGRAVAGNTFSQPASSTGGGSTGSSPGTSPNNNPAPVTLGSQRPAQAVHVTVDLVPNKMFDAKVVNIVVTDMNTGGPTRNATRREISRQE